jgi:hypothetical protein
MQFYLGGDPAFLKRTDVPLFVSARRLRERMKCPVRALGQWSLDSGAFTELKDYGRWTISPQQYADETRRWQVKVGNLQWAAPQDWMCEPIVIAGGRIGKTVFVGTKLSVREHQRLTVANYLELVRLAPDLPWIPVLQGWEFDDYLCHVEDYGTAGVDLTKLPLVGLGSVCRRQDTGMAEDLIRYLYGQGISIHGFGFKLLGLKRCAPWLTSSDSMSWSYEARRGKPLPGCPHRKCNNCLRYALRWRSRVDKLIGRKTRTGERQNHFAW